MIPQPVNSPCKIGIMGGTFNPIHTGHLLLAETALSSEGLQKVMFIPSGKPYMKDEDSVLDASHRQKMVELAIADNPSFSVSDMEIRRLGNTYTSETLTILKQEQPETEFYFILGADNLFTMETWKEPEKIFSACTILAAVRNGVDNAQMQEKCRELSDNYHAKIKLLSFPETDISSTDIRMLIRQNKSIRYMVPEPVRRYIEKNQLYSAK